MIVNYGHFRKRFIMMQALALALGDAMVSNMEFIGAT